MSLLPPTNRSRNPQPNAQQLKAIEDLDNDLLVAAGAGSGKTWVLTERYMEMLVRGARPRQIVAITFTELAAAEMKRRIRGAVQKWIEQTADPNEKRKWRDLYNELDTAIISTIHGFCMRILKEHPVEAGIDPLAEVLEPDEATRLLEEAADEVLEQALTEAFAEIQPLYLAWGGRRGLLGSLLEAHDAVQTFDYPVAQIVTETAASLTRMQQEIAVQVDRIDHLLDVFVRPELAAIMGGKKKLPQYALDMDAWISRWSQQAGLLRCWDGIVQPQIRQLIRDLAKGMWRKSGSESLKEAHELIKGALSEISKREISPDAMDRVHVFCRLLNALEESYQAKKDARHALDFHDLERLSSRTLKDNPQVAKTYRDRLLFVMIDEFQDTNRLQKSIIDELIGSTGEVRRFLVGDGKQSIYKFRGADVDVFQEVEAEHSGNGGSRADGAQSVSGGAGIGDQTGEGYDSSLADADRLIDMGVNFRTQAGIINYINDFFAGLMQGADTKSVRQVRFAPLIAARNPEHDNACVEILCHDALEEEDDSRDGEAELVARRIRQLVNTRAPLVFKKGSGDSAESANPVQFGDVAILFSVTTHMDVYERALQKYGIPYMVEKGRQFYQKQEIIEMISWLQAIADPADEVALAAILRSPVFALSDEALFWLAQEGSITAGLQSLTDYNLQAYVQAGALPAAVETAAGMMIGTPPAKLMQTAVSGRFRREAAAAAEPSADTMIMRSRLRERMQPAEFRKAEHAGQKLAQWREEHRMLPLADFIRKLLAETGYLELLLAGFSGEQRYANVLKLQQMAQDLQREEGYGLTEFVGHLLRMQAAEVKETEAQLGSGSSAGGAVRLMTVHASKGLEFPVVFLPEMKRPVKGGNPSLRSLVRPGWGAGLKSERYGESADDGKLDVQGDGLFLLMKEQEDERELLEEHRKLYVAMTRARDYLILTAARPKMNRTSWQKWVMDHAGLDWKSLTYGVLEKGDLAGDSGYRILVNGDVPIPAANTQENERKPWKLLQGQMQPQAVRHDTGTGAATGPIEAAREDAPSLLFSVGDPASLQMPALSASAYMAYHQCARRFYFRYLLMLPEMELKNLPALADISAHSLPDGEESEIMIEEAGEGAAHPAETQTKPSRKRVHASVRGTLVHELFEHLQSDSNLQELVRTHVQSAKGVPSDAQAELMDYLEKMARSYLNSPWFRPDSHREQSFYLKVGNSLVHGFMDAVLPEEDGSLTVVDFKTNEVRGEQHLRELTDKYRLQLQLYALGARAVFQKPVNRAVLFFLDAETAVEVDVTPAEVDKLAGDLAQTCAIIMERSTMDSYPLTDNHTDCTRCGYRVLCGRTEGDQ